MNPLQPAYGGGGNCGGNPLGDAFVTKINPTGSALVYSTYLGGSGYDFGKGIAVDSTGNAYVTGSTTSTNFPTMNPLQPANGGGTYGYDSFVTKINPEGSALVYSTYLGGSGDDFGGGIAADSAGNTYVTGYTYSTDFPTTPGSFQTTCSYIACAVGEGFVSKINPEGSALVYSTYFGGTGAPSGGGSAGTSIAVDGPGNAYVTGQTSSTDFPVTPGAFQTVCKGCKSRFGGSAFVTKFNPAGSALVYSTYLGGGGDYWGQGATGIAVDGGGKAYVIGYTSSSTFPKMKALQPTYGGNTDAFVSKIDLRPATTTTLTSSPNPSTHGQPVTFTATVTSGVGAPPDGETVKFMKGTTVLGTESLSGGSASFTTSTLPVGTDYIKAVYVGDMNFAPSTSKAVAQVVN